MGLHVRSASGSWLMAGVRDKIEVQVEELKKKKQGDKKQKNEGGKPKQDRIQYIYKSSG